MYSYRLSRGVPWTSSEHFKRLEPEKGLEFHFLSVLEELVFAHYKSLCCYVVLMRFSPGDLEH